MAEPIKSLKTPSQSESFDHAPSSEANYNTEIANLRSEIASLRDTIATRTGQTYDKVARSASSAADYVSSEATSVADTIREHPAATTTLFSLIGAIGFAVGYLVATASAESKQAWYHRYLNDRF
jgi:hypothetical protein